MKRTIQLHVFLQFTMGITRNELIPRIGGDNEYFHRHHVGVHISH